jgi:hypothetical protein
MIRPIDPIAVRDCYQQVKSVRRLVNALTDDLGDLSMSHPDRSLFEASHIKLADFERWLHSLQAELEVISRGKP